MQSKEKTGISVKRQKERTAIKLSGFFGNVMLLLHHKY